MRRISDDLAGVGGGKKDVMKRKGGLRGRKIWIGDDMTWKESGDLGKR